MRGGFVDEKPQPFRGPQIGPRAHARHAVLRLGDERRHDRVEKRFLVPEALIDRPHRAAGGPGDVGDARALIASGGKHILGGREKLVAHLARAGLVRGLRPAPGRHGTLVRSLSDASIFPRHSHIRIRIHIHIHAPATPCQPVFRKRPRVNYGRRPDRHCSLASMHGCFAPKCGRGPIVQMKFDVANPPLKPVTSIT